MFTFWPMLDSISVDAGHFWAGFDLHFNSQGFLRIIDQYLQLVAILAAFILVNAGKLKKKVDDSVPMSAIFLTAIPGTVKKGRRLGMKRKWI